MNKLLFIFVLQVIPLACHATEGDTFRPYVSSTFSYDDNLLRQDSAINPFISTGKQGFSDTIYSNAAGVDVNWDFMRQHFFFSAELSDNVFNRFNELDFHGRDLSARWDWVLGKTLTGEVGYKFNRALASFADVSGIQGNLRDESRRFINVSWLFHPRYRLDFSLSDYTLNYFESQQKVGDREQTEFDAGLFYLTPKGSEIGVNVKEIIGRYPGRNFTPSSALDDAYQQMQVEIIARWMLSVKSEVNFKTGYVKREHEHLSQRDYNAINTRISYGWSPSSKLKFELAAWQQTEPRDDLISSISKNKGVSIGPIWSITDKLAIRGLIQVESRENASNTGVNINNISALSEDNDKFVLSVNYEPYRSVNLNASYSEESRDSNQYLSDYDAKMFNVRLMVKM